MFGPEKYRKAKKGETPCKECVHSRPPYAIKKRYRCSFNTRYTYVVGKLHTCEYAQTVEQYNKEKGYR